MIMWSLLKNWKLLLGVIGIAAMGLFVFDYQRVHSNAEELETSLKDAEKQKESLQNQVSLVKMEYEALEKSLDNYQRSLDAAQESHEVLQTQLEKEAKNDEELEQCLGRTLSPELLNSLSK